MIDLPHDLGQGRSRPPLLIVGASTRASAFCALRAGFLPFCIDQFADADLHQHAEVHAVKSLSLAEPGESDSLLAALSRQPHLPIILAGGMENQPEAITHLHQTRTVWGTSPESMHLVRQPDQLVRGLEEVKQRVLEVSLNANEPPPRDGSWIVKPIASAGGRGIFIWDDSSPQAEPNDRSFFQRRVHGNTYSALFIASCQPGDVRFVGLTRQLVGCPELHAAPFAWCGNIGPAFLSMEAEFLIRRWGNILKWKFGLTGLFGIDFIVDDAGDPWLLEVNPRLTGSVEILEVACGLSLLSDHVACYAPEVAAAARDLAAPPVDPIRDRLGRAVLYAPYRLTAHIPIPEVTRWDNVLAIADIPSWGATIEAGQPLCSVYAWGDEEADVERKLYDAAAHALQKCQRIDEQKPTLA